MIDFIEYVFFSAENSFVLMAVFLASAVSCLYGVIVILPKRKGIFYQTLVVGFGCTLMSNLYYLITYWTGNSLMANFDVGNFGEIGCFLFFIIANKSEYGDMIDDRRPEYAGYRKRALAAPILLFAEFMVFMMAGFSEGSLIRFVIFAVITCLLAYAGYYSLKYALIPGEEGSVASSFRIFNIVLLIEGFVSIAERGMWFLWNDEAPSLVTTGAQVLVYVVLIVAELAVLPLVERGSRKLTTQF